VIGGSIAQTAGWRWIFWFLTIVIGATGLVVLLFFPETQRNIVGNGSLKARGLLYQSLFPQFQPRGRRAEYAPTQNEGAGRMRRRRWPNPLASLSVLAEKGSLVAILLYGITYAVKMSLHTSLGSQAVQIYRLDSLAAGLIYLPNGVSGGIGSWVTGSFCPMAKHPSAPIYVAESG
jgi:predicted MFS family arabinose efflux permease